MEYSIIIADERVFARDIEKIDQKTLNRIFEKIEEMKVSWREHAQVKKLKNYPVADYRIRVGEYRILFNISLERREILIIRALHRSKLY